MELLKLILASSIIFSYPLYAASEYMENNSTLSVKTRLPDYIIPKHYDIRLDQGTSNDNFLFSGNCRVFIKINKTTQNIYLHAQQPHIKIDYAVLIKVYSKVGKSETYVPKWKTYDKESHILSFHFDVLLHGYYILQTNYIITSDDNNVESLFKTTDIGRTGYITHNRWLFATHVQAIGARRIFPCWDEPAFKATFNISILQERDYYAVTNMPVYNAERYSMTLRYFEQTPVISTHLVAIMMSNFSYTVYNDFRMHFYSLLLKREHIQFALDLVTDVMSHLESKWKYYKIPLNVDYVATPGIPRDCVEYYGIVFFRDTFVTYNNELYPVAHKLNVANIVARAVVHQSFGNLNTPLWWSYAWMKEGISTLLALDAIDEIYPNFHILDLFVVQILQESLRLDSHYFFELIMKPLTSEANTPSEINSLFSFSYYKKAPAILRMLQHVLSKNVFRNGIEKFLEKDLTNSDDLWAAMQDALESLSLNEYLRRGIEKFDVKEIMDPWTKLKHYPILNVVQHNTTHTEVLLKNIDAYHQQMLWIPVTRLRQDYLEHSDSSLIRGMWLNPAERDKQVFVPYDHSNNSIIINSQQAGYYRVYYYFDNWRKIARQLNTTEYTNIHVLNRAQIIDDAFYFLINDQFDLSIFLELAKYLQEITDYVAWYPMIKALEYMSCYFPFDKSAYIKEYMRNILSVLLRKIGYTEETSEEPDDNGDSDLIKCLRQEAAKWACILGDQTCKKNAADKLKWHLDNSTTNKLLPWWKKWTYCNGFNMSYTDSNITWWSVFDEWMKTSDSRLMEFLSCGVGAPRCKDANMQAKERINCFFFTIVKYANNNMTLKYILDYFEEIKPREINTYAALIVIINHLYSEEHFYKINEFMSYNEKKTRHVVHILSGSYHYNEKVDKCVNKCLIKDLTVRLLKSKLKIRSSEIARQMHYFQILTPKQDKNKL